MYILHPSLLQCTSGLPIISGSINVIFWCLFDSWRSPSPLCYVLPFCNESDNFGVLESEHWSFILTSAAAVFPCQRIEAALEIKAKKSSLEIKKKTVHHYGAGRGELKKSFIKNDDSFLLTFQVAPRFPVYSEHYTTGCLKSRLFESGT